MVWSNLDIFLVLSRDQETLRLIDAFHYLCVIIYNYAIKYNCSKKRPSPPSCTFYSEPKNLKKLKVLACEFFTQNSSWHQTPVHIIYNIKQNQLSWSIVIVIFWSLAHCEYIPWLVAWFVFPTVRKEHTNQKTRLMSSLV